MQSSDPYPSIEETWNFSQSIESSCHPAVLRTIPEKAAKLRLPALLQATLPKYLKAYTGTRRDVAALLPRKSLILSNLAIDFTITRLLFISVLLI